MDSNVNEVRVSGRFGNQVFQICAALYLRKQNGNGILLDARNTRPADLKLLYMSGLLSDHELLLTNYQKKFLLGSKWALIFDQTIRFFNYAKYRLEVRIPKLATVFRYRNDPKYIEDGEWVNLLNYGKDVYGYFQDWNLVKEVWDELAIRFRSSNLVDINCRKPQSMLLHIRMGDFLKHSAIGVLDLKYYQNAIAKFGAGKSLYYVTDDSRSVQKTFGNFLAENEIMHINLNEFEEFKFLLNSNLLVIANSTFSYWAGIFSKMISAENIVIAPSQWRADGDKQYIIPPIFIT